jgi:hypothetical protein
MQNDGPRLILNKHRRLQHATLSYSIEIPLLHFENSHRAEHTITLENNEHPAGSASKPGDRRRRLVRTRDLRAMLRARIHTSHSCSQTLSVGKADTMSQTVIQKSESTERACSPQVQPIQSSPHPGAEGSLHARTDKDEGKMLFHNDGEFFLDCAAATSSPRRCVGLSEEQRQTGKENTSNGSIGQASADHKPETSKLALGELTTSASGSEPRSGGLLVSPPRHPTTEVEKTDAVHCSRSSFLEQLGQSAIMLCFTRIGISGLPSQQRIPGFCSSFCMIELGTQSIKTEIAHGTTQPTWSQRLTLVTRAESEEHDTVTIRIMTWEPPDKSHLLGSVSLPLSLVHDRGAETPIELHAHPSTGGTSTHMCVRVEAFVTNLEGSSQGPPSEPASNQACYERALEAAAANILLACIRRAQARSAVHMQAKSLLSACAHKPAETSDKSSMAAASQAVSVAASRGLSHVGRVGTEEIHEGDANNRVYEACAMHSVATNDAQEAAKRSKK